MAANAAAAALEKRKEKALNDVVAQLEAKFLDGVFSGADVDEILTKAKIHLDAAKAAAQAKAEADAKAAAAAPAAAIKVHRSASGGDPPGEQLGAWQPTSLAALSFAHQKHDVEDNVGLLEKCCGADIPQPPLLESGLFGIVDGFGGVAVASK